MLPLNVENHLEHYKQQQKEYENYELKQKKNCSNVNKNWVLNECNDIIMEQITSKTENVSNGANVKVELDSKKRSNVRV